MIAAPVEFSRAWSGADRHHVFGNDGVVPARLSRGCARRIVSAPARRHIAGISSGKGSAMTTSFSLGDLTIHRVIEQEGAFMSALEALPKLTPELLAENRDWLMPAALDANGT